MQPVAASSPIDPSSTEPTKQTEIGDIPKRWQVSSLAEKFDTQLGKMLSQKARQGTNPKPYVRNANVQWGRVDVEDMLQMDFTEAEQAKFRLQRGDLLVCEGGEIGRTAIWLDELPECYFQKAIHRLRPKSNDILPEFFLYWMERCFRMANFYRTQGAKTTIAHLPQDKLEELKIPVTDVDEQRAITLVFNSVQNAKEARQRELDLERERKAALMEHLFTYGTRGEPTKQTEIGEIPTSWQLATLNDVARITSGGTPDRKRPEYWKGGVPWVKTGEIRYNTIRRTEESISKIGLENSAAKIIPAGTLLMAMYGQGITRGKVAILGIDATLNQACAAILLSGRVLPRFAFFFLQFSYKRIRILGHGANQKNLNAQLVGSIRIPVPSLDEQKEISELFTSVDAKVTLMEDEYRLLDELFRAVLEELMTGRLSAAPLIDESVAS
jgi:type I restriction enzyme S subunit